MRMRGAFILFLLLATVSVSAQEAAVSQMISRRLLLSVARPQGSAFTVADAVMIGRSLLGRLQESSTEFVVVESPSETTGDSTDQLGTLAKQVGTDAWMQVALDGGWSAAKLGVRAFDLLSNTMVAELFLERTGWGSPGGLAQETWAEVVQAISGKLHMVESAAPVADGAPQARLTITALPGSVVTGLGKQPLPIEADGSVSRTLPAQREYVLRTSLAGYEPVTKRIFLTSDREIRIEQKRGSRWGWEVSLFDSRAPGLDVIWSEPALSFFLRFGFSTYALGLALSSTDLFLSQPLTYVVMQAGFYLGPEDRFLRVYLALGGFARVVHAKDTAPMLDQLAPVGLRLVVGAEVPGMPGGRLYFEYLPTVYQTSVPEAFRAALGSEDVPGWIFGTTAALSLLSFRIGYRWQI